MTHFYGNGSALNESIVYKNTVGLVASSFSNQENFNAEKLFPVPEKHLRLIAGDASDRKFYRVVDYRVSAICMEFPKWEGGYGGDPLSWLGMHQALHSIGIPVPQVYYVDKEHCRIWTEDLGDAFLNCTLPPEGLNYKHPLCAQSMQYYCEALELLVCAQYPKVPLPACPAQSLAFDTEKLLFELNFFATYFLRHLMGIPFDEDEWQPLKDEFLQLASWLSARERVLCHRDYHVRNVMIYAGRCVWIDFQDARMGPHTYDVVSLVRDSYVKITEDTRKFLYNFYLEKLNIRRQECGLQPLLPEDYYREIQHMGLQRNIKALGSFAYLALIKGKPHYLNYVFDTLNTLCSQSSLYDVENLCETYPHLITFLQSLRAGPWRNILVESIERVVSS